MSKVTPLPKQTERSAAHILRLLAIAGDLEARADALRHHALQIRKHAASLQTAADRLRKNRKPYSSGAKPIR